jgi:hypothetical protein
MYFKSKSIENKKYYLDLYLKLYLKNVKEDTSNLINEYFIEQWHSQKNYQQLKAYQMYSLD